MSSGSQDGIDAARGIPADDDDMVDDVEAADVGDDSRSASDHLHHGTHSVDNNSSLSEDLDAQVMHKDSMKGSSPERSASLAHGSGDERLEHRDGQREESMADADMSGENEPQTNETVPEPAAIPDTADDAALAVELASGRPKRQRRRPQRWEGALLSDSRRTSRRAGVVVSAQPAASTPTAPSGGVLALLHPAARRASRASFGSGGLEVDDATTASIHTVETGSPVPEAVDPLESMREALDLARETPGGKRAIVDAFNAWQLRTISAESSHQKLLHGYLRRKLRKRASRMNERERTEEDALRNACSAPPVPSDGWSSPPDGAESSVDAFAAAGRARKKYDSDDESEDGVEPPKKKLKDSDDLIVPSKVRLPLESYMPRRVKKSNKCLRVNELLAKLPSPPRLQGTPALRVWRDPPPRTACGEGADLKGHDGENRDDEARSSDEVEQ